MGLAGDFLFGCRSSVSSAYFSRLQQTIDPINRLVQLLNRMSVI
jgi:hypothetical protein